MAAICVADVVLACNPQAPLPGLDPLYALPSSSAPITGATVVTLKTENDPYATLIGSSCGEMYPSMERSAGLLLPPPQLPPPRLPPLWLPPPERFPPALQALAEQQRLFMERKYQEQVRVWPFCSSCPYFEFRDLLDCIMFRWG